MKLVHAADLHIDSPMQSLELYEGAPTTAMRSATRRALRNLVDLCIDESAALLLIAGDIYDGNWKDYSTGLYFASEMSRLREANIPVVIVRGNHDAASQITKNLRLPDNVFEMPTQAAITKRYDDLGIAVHGQSFATRDVSDDLAKGYPAPDAGALNIGILHTCADGRPGHDRYAPTSLSTLIEKGYDYFALGHVHTREVLSSHPWVVFPGNLQGRHAREVGPKGATLIEVQDGRIASVEHRVVDAARWSIARSDAKNGGIDDALSAIRESVITQRNAAGDRPLAVRVVVRNAGAFKRAHATLTEKYENEVRTIVNDVGNAWLERIEIHAERARDGEATDAIARVAAAVRTAREGDDASLAELGKSLSDVIERLPPELREGEDGLRLDDPACLRELLADAEESLLGRLLSLEDRT